MDTTSTLGNTDPQRSLSTNQLYQASAAYPRPGLDRVGSQSRSRDGYGASSPVAEPQIIPTEPFTREARRRPSNAISPPANPPPGSRYMDMLLALDDIPPIHNILIGFFTWILLAGFVLFPGTFTNLQAEAKNGETGLVQSAVVGTLRQVPLFIVACACTGIGAIGMICFWYRWQSNYIWLVNRIFLPGLLNSLAGVVSTLSSVYGAHNYEFEGTSRSTIIVTGGLTVVCGMLTLFYMLILLRNLKKKHDVEHGERRAGRHGEGYRSNGRF